MRRSVYRACFALRVATLLIAILVAFAALAPKWDSDYTEVGESWTILPVTAWSTRITRGTIESCDDHMFRDDEFLVFCRTVQFSYRTRAVLI